MKKTALSLALMTMSGLAHAVSGQVTDASGKPISGAAVEVTGSQLQARTDEQGRFVLDATNATASELHINAPGYSHKTVLVNGAEMDTLQITLRRSAIEQIDVTATPLHTSTMESALPVTVLAGDNLRSKQAATLGETLKNEVGVHSTYFGPVASSPVIRGLSGPRVLITQNSLDVSDASRVGPDHVVATEALTAEQIEILRGPATLFYGSGAIGGVVNVVDDRVPSSSEAKGAFQVGHNTVNNEEDASFAYTGGGEQFAFHVDGFTRKGDNYEIPGVAELEMDHDHEGEEGHEHEEQQEQSAGILENSASESQGFNLGGSWLLDNGYIGLAYGRLERLNGIPGHSHAHGDEHGEEHEGELAEESGAHEHDEEVLSDLKQDRWQLISELSLDNTLLSGVNTRIGYTDYEHVEIENNETGTLFQNETVQARVDLLLQEVAGWRGALSLEGKTSDFAAVGEEAFTSPSRTDTLAVALMQEKRVGDFLWQVGGRVEKVSIEADPIEWESHDHSEEHKGEEHEHEESALLEFDTLDFTPYSVSAGVVWDFAADYNAGLSLTHAQRAPSASELFSYGPHIGTGSFEVGALFDLHVTDEPHFDYSNSAEEEISNNIDLSLRKHSGDIGWVVNLFYNEVGNFYYERDTGFSSEEFGGHDHEEHAEGEAHAEGEEHEHSHDHGALPVYVFEQADSVLYGMEAQLAWQISDPLTVTLWGDSIRGKLKDGGDLPRIPPVRLGGRLTYAQNGWEAGFGVSHYFEQDKVAELETSTDGYTLLDAELGYTIPSAFGDMTVFLKGNNLTDEEARVHASFLKDRAPLPGRGFSLGMRGTF
ncbi:TonB-dependent receptor [Microbulbifer flavimaris]|uniref:TonB-dependent receptor n=1 Tax=Microbulbifer flavimaris TaxID=1781068 RepID=A0ABX4I364_9GAMM|nr:MULTISPECIES: TonB-dependent receptor [Microbulbifer]KUJ84768.1 TonB-dependent receptor [Microbulbifer sp. ZGT114]PCO06862.1 TonB-dependent receptor [Microbulbifer flavimaris]